MNSTFFEEFSDLIELVASKVAPVLIVSDVNIHLDNPLLDAMTNILDIVSDCDMKQLGKEPTQRAAHTLDVVIVHSSTTATVSVDPTVISDQSLITVVVNVGSATEPQATNVSRWNWFNIDFVEFDRDLLSSELYVSPPRDVDKIVECYNHCLCDFVNKHALLETKTIRSH